MKDNLLDLGRILDSKFKRRKVPRWLVALLSRVFHIDFLNRLISAAGDRKGAEFCLFAAGYLGLKLEVSGLENIPADGTLYTFASNHPLGGADGIVLCGIIGERFGSVLCPVNDFLTYVKPLAPIFVPVNKVGAQSRNLPEIMDRTFRSDRQVLYFPSGKCSRIIDGKVQDPEWRKTFLKKSIESGRRIVPVHFIAENSGFFYGITKFFSDIGIRFNIGMLLLPREFYQSRGKKCRIVFGEPISPSVFDGTKTLDEWTEDIRQRVYTLQ